MSNIISEEFAQAVEQFNQQQFYPCHDTLEALWMEAPEPEKTFYQGILQIAVACYHLGNHNWRGAVILLGEGSRKLRDYPPDYAQINVHSLLEQSNQLLADLQQIEPKEIATLVQTLRENNGFPRIDKVIQVS